jgi:hypothetical protein
MYKIIFSKLARDAAGDRLAALEERARREIFHAVGYGEPLDELPRWGFHCFEFEGVAYIATFFATDAMEVDRAASDSFEFDGNELVPQGTYSFPIRASDVN